MRPYPELPGLDALYLEDSYVLGVREEATELRFELEAVLTEAHPKWSTPKSGEQYAYLPVDLVFPHPRRVEWIERTMKPISGPDGERDFGNIDSFVWRPGWFEMKGEWGHVRIESDPPIVVER